MLAYIENDEVRADIPSTLKAGKYSVWLSAKYEGRDVACSYEDAFEIVKWSHPEAFVAKKVNIPTAFYLYGGTMTDDELEALKEEYCERIQLAKAAEKEFDHAKDEADAVAYEAVEGIPERFEGLKEDVKEAVKDGLEGATVEADLTPVTSRLDDEEHGLSAIKKAVDEIEVPIPEGIATEANATDNKNEVLTAIGNIHVDVPSDVSRETEQYATENAAKAAQSAAEAAKAAAENITIPADVARKSDIPTDYAKDGTFTAWVNGLWSQFVSRIETAIAGLAKPSDIPSVAEVQDGLAKEANATTNKQDILTAIAVVQASSYKGVPTIAASGNITSMPNQLYVWSSAVGALTITKGAEQEGIVNEYIFRFSGASSVTFAGWSLTWNGGDAPLWDASKTYEISIVDNIALYAEL